LRAGIAADREKLFIGIYLGQALGSTAMDSGAVLLEGLWGYAMCDVAVSNGREREREEEEGKFERDKRLKQKETKENDVKVKSRRNKENGRNGRREKNAKAGTRK
jgi:hypothetical protein